MQKMYNRMLYKSHRVFITTGNIEYWLYRRYNLKTIIYSVSSLASDEFVNYIVAQTHPFLVFKKIFTLNQRSKIKGLRYKYIKISLYFNNLYL